MKPLKLRMSGLRSWRTEQVLDFHDVDLAAVVGPTGAGKSSILEAIIYALYNKTTYEGNVRSLISSDVGTVSVAFDFEADGENWRATRSTSHKNYPLPVHKLVCLTDPERHPVVDGRTAVTEAVTRLLGLNVEQFTSAVLLPQGRFQRLLTATDGERTAILKGVFRLDELEEMRERASEVRRNQVDPALEAAHVGRSRLLPDPVAERAGALEHFETSDALVVALEACEERHTEQVAAMGEQAVLALAASESAGRVRTALQAVPSLDGAIAADRELAGRESQLAETRTAATDKRIAARAAVRAAEEEGRTVASLSTARQVLAGAADVLPRHAERASGLVRRGEALDAAEVKLAADRERLASERERLNPLTAERDRLAKASADAAGQLTAARERLRELRDAVKSELDALETAEKAEAKLGEARATETETARAAELAQASLEAAERMLEATRRGHAAAHLAEELAAGDECPVCRGTVPDGFAPGEPPTALTAAEQALAVERAAATRASDSAATARTLVSTRAQAADDARAAHQSAVAKAAAAVDAAVLANVLPPAPPLMNSEREAVVSALRAIASGALADDDAVPLASHTDAAQTAADAERTASEAVTRLAASVETTGTRLAERGDDLSEQRTEFGAQASALETERADLLAGIARLPTFVRPASIDELALRTAEGEAAEALAHVQQLIAGERAASEAVGALETQSEELRDSRELRVDAPLRSALRAGDALALQLEEAPARPEDGAPLERHAAWLAELSTAAETAIAAQSAAGADAERRRAAAKELAAAELTAQGLDSIDALTKRLTDERTSRRVAERRIERADDELPKVEALELRITALRERREALDEVARLLNDGQFVGWLVARRQRHLLTVASEILAGMTGTRYRFAADFTVVDDRSGQPRSARTLSGGESFLASLALALGMAELAARSGGRIGSLYLDEGFGSLDPNALDEAIDALETRARAGQMIIVISHVPAVAQRIERVLQVTPSPTGSTAAWLDDADRDVFLAPAGTG